MQTDALLIRGKSNDFPREAAKVVSETSVLNTGLRFLRLDLSDDERG